MNNYVYVGCGNHRLDSFIHIDIDYAKRFKKGEKVPEPDFICDITKKLPFQERSVDLIFSRETLEHLTYRELINHFIECHKVLKIGGKVRISVPDLDIMVNNFMKRENQFLKKKEQWEIDKDFPIENHSEFFVAQTLYHDHRYNHNFETLSNSLKKVGFENITKSKAGDFDINNDVINNQIKQAEIGKDRLLFVTAEKKNINVNCERFTLKKNKNFINKILAKIFNLEIKPANLRKPHFPQKNYFYEKIYFIKKILRNKKN